MIRAYTGQPADDTPDKPSQALTAYLRQTWHTRPWALAIAERQLRDYADHPPGRLRLRLGEPDCALATTASWHRSTRDRHPGGA